LARPETRCCLGHNSAGLKGSPQSAKVDTVGNAQGNHALR